MFSRPEKTLARYIETFFFTGVAAAVSVNWPAMCACLSVFLSYFNHQQTDLINIIELSGTTDVYRNAGWR